VFNETYDTPSVDSKELPFFPKLFRHPKQKDLRRLVLYFTQRQIGGLFVEAVKLLKCMWQSPNMLSNVGITNL